jgi:hypothetical protein
MPRTRQLPTEPTAVQQRWCLDCGGRVFNARHVRCADCIVADPRQTDDVRSRRGRAISSRKRALVEWERANPDVAYDPELFRQEILPRLAGVKLSAIMEAAGISPRSTASAAWSWSMRSAVNRKRPISSRSSPRPSVGWTFGRRTYWAGFAEILPSM